VSHDNPSNPDNPDGARGVSPGAAFSPPKPRKRSGGAQYHKPGCKCLACVRSGRTPAPGPGDAGSAPKVAANLKAPLPARRYPKAAPQDVLDAEPEFLKPFVATGNSKRDRVAQWIYMRSAEPGISNAEVARRLGIAPASLDKVLYVARREGWLQIEDPLDRIKIELLPKIVDNLNYHLDRKDPKVTVEAMKGLLAPLWKEQQGIQDNKIQALAIKIEMPPGGAAVARGVISGVPRRVNAPREDLVPLDATFTDDHDK
jgi:hypothetical protein